MTREIIDTIKEDWMENMEDSCTCEAEFLESLYMHLDGRIDMADGIHAIYGYMISDIEWEDLSNEEQKNWHGITTAACTEFLAEI